MWISKKEWEALSKRVTDLESGVTRISEILTIFIQYKKERAKKYTKSGKTNFYRQEPENLSDEQV